MKLLEISFKGTGEVKDFNFTQLKKSETAYLYHVEDENSNIHFEVFEKKITDCGVFDFISKKFIKNGEQKESYPNSKCFGNSAWTFRNLDKAIEKFKNIN